MSVPAELVQQQMGGPQAGGMPPQASGGEGAKPPAAAPMSTPQDKKGLKAAARTNLHIALNMIEAAIPSYGSESDEGQALLNIATKLGKLFGKRDSSDLVPAEVLQMVSQMPQMGGGTDQQRMIREMMMKQGAKPPQQPGA